MDNRRHYRRFDEIPVGAKFVDAFGHPCVKTTSRTSAHCFETPDDSWYYHVDCLSYQHVRDV
ncbi:hypothetical protein [Mycobacterium avium]|uniref:hypothetical protein n=1 Tax=Mycobacterium avium TaxID=1764 RepID=UPI000AB4E326|nr:hypothetical protein [Mycobacterium avium]